MNKNISSPETILHKVTTPLTTWYQTNARLLPWRTPAGSSFRPDSYHVWISEIMLQQTRVEAVKDYYTRFLKRLPDVSSLAGVSHDELMKLWQGLGYYSRANNLQRAAIQIMEEYGGSFPEHYEEILTLPGIGEYTAGAIASIAFGEAVPAIDGNVYRIYTRLCGDDSDITKTPFKKKLRSLLSNAIPVTEPGSYNQAWMDLGATVCLPNGAPLCSECPLKELCTAYKEDSWSRYPVKPPKKKRKIEDKTIFLLEYQGTYLVQKRPPKGLLAGLWEFPSEDGFVSPEKLQELLAQWDTGADSIELLGRGKHIFSHIEWHMIGYLIHLNRLPSVPPANDGVWISTQKMQKEYSIPSAFRAYYSKITSMK